MPVSPSYAGVRILSVNLSISKTHHEHCPHHSAHFEVSLLSPGSEQLSTRKEPWHSLGVSTVEEPFPTDRMDEATLTERV